MSYLKLFGGLVPYQTGHGRAWTQQGALVSLGEPGENGGKENK